MALLPLSKLGCCNYFCYNGVIAIVRGIDE